MKVLSPNSGLLRRFAKRQLPAIHQAIIDNEPDLLKSLKNERGALEQEDELGFLPIQLAKALGRFACLEVLGPKAESRIRVGEPGSVATTLLSVNEFEGWTGSCYTPFLVAEDYSTLCFAVRACQKSVRKGYFDAERKWLSQWHQRELLTNQVRGVVKWVDSTIGFGLFAERDLQPYEFVGTYAGRLIRRDFFLLRSNDYCFRYPIGIETIRPLIIDAEEVGNELRFANHSDQPNMEGIGLLHGPIVQVAFRTARAVRQGEQLTYDYGPDYWKYRDVKKRLL